MTDSDNDTCDDVAGIKRAMRISRARQKALLSNHTNQTSPTTGSSQVAHERSGLNRKQQDYINRLEAQLLSREEELTYLKKTLKIQKNNLDESNKYFELKSQAIEQELRQHFKESNENLIKKHKVLEMETAKLAPLVAAIERNTMHGRHMTPTETNMSLIIKLKEGLQAISRIMHDALTLDGVKSTRKDENNKSSTLDCTLLEVCQNLEEENARLRREAVSTEAQMATLKSESSKSSLIPQYRAAIVTLKTDLLKSQTETSRLQAVNDLLQQQLKTVRAEIELSSTERVKLQGLLQQMKDERDKYKTAINDMLQNETKVDSSRDYKDLLSEHTGITGAWCSKVSSKPLYDETNDPLPYRTQHAASMSSSGDVKEEAVQRDLALLDSEIGDLRRRLEAAAVAQTHSIVSEVMGSATAKT